MTGPSGNKLSICPLRFRIIPPRIWGASVNRNCWGGDPESLGANRSAYYPRDQSLFVYYSLEDICNIAQLGSNIYNIIIKIVKFLMW